MAEVDGGDLSTILFREKKKKNTQKLRGNSFCRTHVLRYQSHEKVANGIKEGTCFADTLAQALFLICQLSVKSSPKPADLFLLRIPFFFQVFFPVFTRFLLLTFSRINRFSFRIFSYVSSCT